MKTIKERAEEYEENYPNMDDSYYSYYVRDGYIKGATDQQEIFIEKACELLEDMLMFGCHPCGGHRMVLDFRKEMEEQMKECISKNNVQ